MKLFKNASRIDALEGNQSWIEARYREQTRRIDRLGRENHALRKYLGVTLKLVPEVEAHLTVVRDDVGEAV